MKIAGLMKITENHSNEEKKKDKEGNEFSLFTDSVTLLSFQILLELSQILTQR